MFLMNKRVGERNEYICRVLERDANENHLSPMSSMLYGENDIVLPSIQHAFEEIAADYHVVMNSICANNCPKK